MSAQDQVDLTASDLLRGFVEQLLGKGIIVYLADVHAPVLADARARGLLDMIGEDHVFPTVEEAVRAIEAAAE